MQCNEQQAVDILNRFLPYDSSAVSAVFNSRFKLTEEGGRAAEADASLVVGCFNGKDDAEGLTIGPLGIINGLFGSKIAAHYDDDGKILHFSLKQGPCSFPGCVDYKAAHP